MIKGLHGTWIEGGISLIVVKKKELEYCRCGRLLTTHHIVMPSHIETFRQGLDHVVVKELIERKEVRK